MSIEAPVTSSVSHHVALFVYPWKLPYPVESLDNNQNAETLPRVLLTNSNAEGSGINFISYSRNKGVGGTMEVDFMGQVEPSTAYIGNWCVLNTSASGPIKDIDDGITRFIGQVYAVNSQFFADAEGNLRRTIKLSIREWSHVLNCPVRYSVYSSDLNSTLLQKQQNIKGVIDTGNAAIAELAKQSLNVFQQPFITLAFLGAVSEDDSSLLGKYGDAEKDLSATIKNLSVFSNLVSRLPILPQALLDDVFKNKGTGSKPKSETPWSTGFMELFSGVQQWEKIAKPKSENSITKPNGTVGTAEQIIGNKGTKDWFINYKAKRPISLYSAEHAVEGGTLNSIISQIVSSNGAGEFYTDLWYMKGKNGKIFAQPSFVVRDIPWSLRAYAPKEEVFPWTYLDDLPRVHIPASNIITINIGHTLENTGTLIVIGSQPNVSFGKAETTAQATYFGSTKLDQAQRRFGGQEFKSSVREVTTAEQTASTAQNAAAKLDVDLSWLKHFADRKIQWYGCDYLFYKCSLQIKDSDFLITVGNNLQFQLSPSSPVLVGHVEGVDSRYKLVEGGLITNTTYVYLSRVCYSDKDDMLQPLPHSAGIDLLKLRDEDIGKMKLEMTGTISGRSEAAIIDDTITSYRVNSKYTLQRIEDKKKADIDAFNKLKEQVETEAKEKTKATKKSKKAKSTAAKSGETQ